ncbi:hypothetical protein [Salmonella phage SD-15_S21]|nr:hypothetical protein [Salmonella phage SD-15_S21]
MLKLNIQGNVDFTTAIQDAIYSKSVTADAADLYKAIGDSFEKMETVFSKDKSIKLHRRNHPEHPVLDDLTENEE